MSSARIYTAVKMVPDDQTPERNKILSFFLIGAESFQEARTSLAVSVFFDPTALMFLTKAGQRFCDHLPIPVMIYPDAGGVYHPLKFLQNHYNLDCVAYANYSELPDE